MLANSLVELDRAHLIHPVASTAATRRRASACCVRQGRDRDRCRRASSSSTGSPGCGASTPAMATTASSRPPRGRCASCPMRRGISASAPSRPSGSPPELAERAPGDLNHVYFTLGGSDAVDSTVRFIRYYWNARGRPQKDQFISLEQGYHGSSTVGAGLTALPAFHAGFGVPYRLAAQDPVALPLSQPGRRAIRKRSSRPRGGAARQGRGARRPSASPPSTPSRSRARAA